MNQVQLDSTYPNGIYTFDVTDPSNEHQFLTNFLVEGVFPNVPTIANLMAAQSVDVSNDFALVWNAFAGGTVTDFIQLQIQTGHSNAFVTPSFGAAGALNGTASSAIIPAGTLLPGRAYEA